MASPPAWSIGLSKRDNSTTQTLVLNPGPGAYDFSCYIKRKAPGWKMGTANRKALATNDSPGPGTYETPSKSKRAPKYSFSRRNPIDHAEDTPGPGAYDQRRMSMDLKKRGFTFQSKSFMSDYRSDSPGPGAYNQHSMVISHRAPVCKIGNSKRAELNESRESPGPGTYISDINQSFDISTGPRYGFGTSFRKENESSQKMAPGPGAYNFSSLFDTAKKGFTISSRRPDSAVQELSHNPGPGAYTPTILKKRWPSCRIGSALRSFDREGSQSPGPGAYDLDRSLTKLGSKIGSDKRRSLIENTFTPGPGAYECKPVRKEAPKYGMIPRRENSLLKEGESPGPGSYSPSVELIKSQISRAKIGTSNRSDMSNNSDSPGPGAYNLRGDASGPKYRFTSASRIRQRLENGEIPGPGTYNLPAKFADVARYALPGRR